MAFSVFSVFSVVQSLLGFQIFGSQYEDEK